MKIEDRRDGIERLTRFVCLLSADNVTSRETFRAWCAVPKNRTKMAELFGYVQKPGMPVISSLVNADFHPTHPLIMFNYTPTAHNTLHAFPEGWTSALRMCRGIVFTLRAELLAHPFPKFFNLGEHPETTLSSVKENGPWGILPKEDGHLGIVFRYRSELVLTTRGSFMSPTSKLGKEMLEGYQQAYVWNQHIHPKTTCLFEVIDPSTEVHVNYGGQQHFVLLAVYDNVTLREWSMDEKLALAKKLCVSPGHTDALYEDPKQLEALIGSMKDRSVRNREGHVITCANGVKVKIKYETYIQMMVMAKLSPTYLMNRILAGTLDKMLSTLDEEVVVTANELLGRILRVLFMKELKEKRRHLYALVPAEQNTPYFRGICNKLIRHLDENWHPAP